MNTKQGYYTPSLLHLKFVNGLERKYDMKMSAMPLILTEIEVINEQMEFERNMAGQDDEMDDETK